MDWKTLPGGSLLLAAMFLFAPFQAQAVEQGPVKGGDGACPTGSSPSQSGDGCAWDLPPLPVIGTTVSWINAGWGNRADFIHAEWYPIPLRMEEGFSPTEGWVWGRKKQSVQKSPCDTTKKPVLIGSGTKLLPEEDFVAAGNGYAFGLSRTYVKDNSKIGIFGQSWSSSLDYTLVFEYENYVCWAYLDKSVACNPNGKPLLVVHAYNPSGYATHFRLNNGVWTSAAGDIAQLVNGDWVIDYRDGSRNTFGTNGKPKTIQDERGIGLIYNYNASNQLLSVAHTSGRTLSLTWSSGKVTAITAPNGKTYSYAYDGNDYLASVTYPDNLGTRTYHYEDSAQPGGLTGLSINDVRQTRYKYYADGRVEWSGFDGGAERSTFAYGTDYTSVTNALGQATMYRLVELGGIKRIWRVERPVSGTCAPGIVDSQYDANGNVDYEVDALGVKTDYSYDAEDRLTQKITGIGPANQTDQQQITQYVWDASRKGRLNQVKVFGTGTSQPLNTTTYTYYPDGDARARLLKSVAVANQGDGTLGTLTTAYDYTLHPNDLVATMTVDGLNRPGNPGGHWV